MHNQIKVEIIRLRKSMFFYLTIAAFAALGFMYSHKVIFVDKRLFLSGEAFLSAIRDTSLIFIMTMFVSYFIGSEFTNRTIDNEIRVGYSRFSVIVSRAIVVLPASILPYMAYIAACELVLIAVNGFSPVLSAPVLPVLFILFLLQLTAIQSITMFVVFACQKASLGMMINIAFSVVTCNLLRNWLDDSSFLFKYTSFYRIKINEPAMGGQAIAISFLSVIINLALMLWLTGVVFKKAELK